MKTRLYSLLLSTPLAVAGVSCWLKFVFSGRGWQDGN